MFKLLLIGFAIISLNVVLQTVASVFWSKTTIRIIEHWENRFTNFRIFRLLSFSFMFLTILHLIHAFIWAFSLYLLPDIHQHFEKFSDIFYYSIVTFTTLGYGDITLIEKWRMLSGIEAINGIMMIGWSTALMYSLIQNVFKIHHGKNTEE